MKDEKKLQFLILNNFTQIEKKISEYFGDYLCLYSDGNINIQIIMDRSIENIEVSKNTQELCWYDLKIIKSLLEKEDQLKKILTYNDEIEFLEKNLDNIKNLFSEKKYLDTKVKLDSLIKENLKKMFPEM